MTTKVATAIAVSAASSPAFAIAADAARVSARFFGLAAEMAMPNPMARIGEMPLIDAIQLGMVAASPGFGRFLQSRAAITRNRRPIPAITQLMPVAASLPGSLALLATSTTITLTAVSPLTQPPANARPLRRSGAVEDEHDRHDGDRAEGDGHRGRQQLADGLVEHA